MGDIIWEACIIASLALHKIFGGAFWKSNTLFGRCESFPDSRSRCGLFSCCPCKRSAFSLRIVLPRQLFDEQLVSSLQVPTYRRRPYFVVELELKVPIRRPSV